MSATTQAVAWRVWIAPDVAPDGLVGGHYSYSTAKLSADYEPVTAAHLVELANTFKPHVYSQYIEPKDGWHETATHGQRTREYRVYFSKGEAIAVMAKVYRGNRAAPYWRECWHRKDGPPTITASCAIRAAIMGAL